MAKLNYLPYIGGASSKEGRWRRKMCNIEKFETRDSYSNEWKLFHGKLIFQLKIIGNSKDHPFTTIVCFYIFSLWYATSPIIYRSKIHCEDSIYGTSTIFYLARAVYFPTDWDFFLTARKRPGKGTETRNVRGKKYIRVAVKG